jgi:hypothetical protein
MSTMMRKRDLTGGTLAGTLGRLVESREAAPLDATGSAGIERWRTECWESLERRAGQLGPRDPAAWYDMLVFERRTQARDTRRLPPVVLEMFYLVKRFIPRHLQLTLRRRLVELQGAPTFPAWPFEVAGTNRDCRRPSGARCERCAVPLVLARKRHGCCHPHA